MARETPSIGKTHCKNYQYLYLMSPVLVSAFLFVFVLIFVTPCVGPIDR